MMDDDDKTTTMNGDDSDECSALDISRHKTRPDQVWSLATATAQVSWAVMVRPATCASKVGTIICSVS
jgi:hypothetical protein